MNEPRPASIRQDLRIGDLIQREIPERPRIVLIGFPSDEGVRRNGGRVGAAEAPDRIREYFYRLTPHPLHEEPFGELLKATFDAGNVRVTGDLEADQERLGQEVARWLEMGAIPVILGGGHETAFGHYLGYHRSSQSMRIFNLDAHPDVRPLNHGQGHSGSPFFQILEYPESRCNRYDVWGLQPWSVAREHLNYLQRKSCRYRWQSDVTPAALDSFFDGLEGRVMLSLDMDVVKQAEAPGVSAPAIEGIPASTWLHAAYRAGLHRNVSSLDLVEVNPRYDIDGRTARLAAVTLWHFVLGRCLSWR